MNVTQWSLYNRVSARVSVVVSAPHSTAHPSQPPNDRNSRRDYNIVIVFVYFVYRELEIPAEYTNQGLRARRDGRGTGRGGGGSGTQWAVTVRLYWLRRGRRRQQCTTTASLRAAIVVRRRRSPRGGPPKTSARARQRPATDHLGWPMDFRVRVNPAARAGGISFYCYPLLF